LFLIFQLHPTVLFNSKRDATFTERAAVALSSLQRNAYSMSLLRGRLEARLKTASAAAPAIETVNPELARMLELVRAGEASLNNLAVSIESARLLEEFITIVNSAAASVSEVKADMEKIVPAAESALDQILDTIVKCSFARSSNNNVDSETQQQLMAEAADAVGAGISLQTAPGAITTIPSDLSNPPTSQKIAVISSPEEGSEELTLA
jgi:hypothetical protein